MEALLQQKASKSKNIIHYYNPDRKTADLEFKKKLSSLFFEYDARSSDVVIVCIGSDRATGDCLGPLVGDKLTKGSCPFYVYGTLAQPVHAMNLPETINTIRKSHNNPLIIAIDASLGTSKHVGYVTLGKGSLQPGIGVDKDLPQVGDIFITGIVNASGMINHMLLQTTRLHVVMHLADFIYTGLRSACSVQYLV